MQIVQSAIDPFAVRRALEDSACGGTVFFEGWVRNHNEGRAVERLEYEVYEPLALKEGEAILGEARQRWPIGPIVCVHRAGVLELGDIAVIVGVASPHRDEAFQAARYVIDEIKIRLPIWKREHYVNGEREWVNCQRCASAHHPRESRTA